MLNKLLNDPKTTGLKPDFQNLGDVVSGFFNVGFYIAAFLAFIWFVWGAFQYIFAGGDKEKISQARARMTWAIVGLMIVIIAFVVAQFVAQILKPKPGSIPLPGISFVPTVYAAVEIKKEFAFGEITSLSQGLGLLVPGAFSVAIVAVVLYFLIGAFKILSSGGDKEAMSGAQRMITHSIIGFVLLMFVFLVFQFILSSLFGIKDFQIIK